MITQPEMEQLVRKILDGADLSQITARTVRAKVLETLGARAGDDGRAIRNSVRDAISVVLGKAKETTETNHPQPQSAKIENGLQAIQESKDADPHTIPHGDDDGKGKANKDSIAPSPRVSPNEAQKGKTTVGSDATWNAQQVEQKGVEQKPTNVLDREEEMDDVGTSATPPETAVPTQEAKPSRGMAIADLLGDASGHDADDENDVGNEQRDDQKRRRPFQKKRRARATLDDDDSDNSEDGANSHDEIVPNDNRARKAGRQVKRRRANDSTNERDFGSRQVKRSRATVLTSESDLEQLKDIIKQLGLKVPPAKVRRTISLADRCAGLVDYLAEKGVNVPNPTLLNKRDISIHRKRLENEKELAGIDESNIISDRRSRRARGSVLVHKPDGNELPSELSGEELSASSEHDEDSDEYQVSSQESA